MGRLFWKLFSAFWLAFVVIIVGAWYGMKMYRDYLERELFEHSTRPEVHTVARTLQDQGEAAAIRLIRELHKARQKLNIVVVDENNRNLMRYPLKRWVRRAIDQAKREPLRFPQRRVTTPDDNVFWVISLGHREGRLPDQRQRHLRDVQWIVLGIASVVSLLLCFGLARYLSRPVKRLSRASRSIAGGDLQVRVSPTVGRRRDEIADLARDFDAMTAKLQTLIDGQQQLLRDVSHELRSPLARLQMAVGLARRRQRDDLSHPELDRIERDIQRLDQLVGQVLTLSRLETDTSDHRSELVDLTALIATIVDDADFEARAQRRRVKLTATATPRLLASAELMRQALENIVRNAVKYTEPDTAVAVAITSDHQRIAIEVCDRGPGAPEPLLERLFDPFVRASEAREHARGYGLGLAIAKRAVELHGGTIEASNRPGSGLCIAIALPLTPGGS